MDEKLFDERLESTIQMQESIPGAYCLVEIPC
jgi:hypothetical protein